MGACSALIRIGDRLRAAGSAEIAGFDATPMPARVQAIIDKVLQTFPQFARCYSPGTAKVWAGLRPVSPSGVGYMGRTSIRNLFVNAGHGHLGWTMSCGAGRLLPASRDHLHLPRQPRPSHQHHGGPSELISIDPPSFFGYVIERNIQYYYLFLVTLGGMLLTCVRLRDSRIGWAWQAIREDELAAEAMGVNTTVAKLQAFAIGASFAGFAGGLLASWQRSVFPDNFLFRESIYILAMVILGGMGNVVGVVVGAAIIVALPEIFRDLALYRLLAFGAILMVLMIFRPQGLFPARPAMAPEEAKEDAAGPMVESAAKP